jgi:hypothetical protein
MGLSIKVAIIINSLFSVNNLCIEAAKYPKNGSVF